MKLMDQHGVERPIKRHLQAETAEVRSLCKRWYALVYNPDGILCYRSEPNEINQVLLKRIVPYSMRIRMFIRIHSAECAHMGYDRVHAMISKSFYWYNMSQDIQEWLRACKSCQQAKTGVGAGRPEMKLDIVTDDVGLILDENEQTDRLGPSIPKHQRHIHLSSPHYFYDAMSARYGRRTSKPIARLASEEVLPESVHRVHASHFQPVSGAFLRWASTHWKAPSYWRSLEPCDLPQPHRQHSAGLHIPARAGPAPTHFHSSKMFHGTFPTSIEKKLAS